MKQPSLRLRSIDAFRALTMLLMIFVNEAGNIQHIPAWIDHVEAEVDGLGFADTIFPAFLFIAGLSLPLALLHRIQKGATGIALLMYILTRALALLVMGFFQVNMEEYNGEAALLSRPLWSLLVTLCFFLIWIAYPRTLRKSIRYLLISTGIAGLAALALVYKGGSEEAPQGMQTHWWGILGMIGWAYLVCALLFMIVRDRLVAVAIAWLSFLTLNILIQAGWLHWYPPVIGEASSVTLMMAGVTTSVFYRHFTRNSRFTAALAWLAMAGVFTIAAGFLLRPHTGGISKIYGTPAWVLICTGISLLVFTAIAWLTDKQGKENWFSPIRAAGSSTLTCYLLPYIINPLLWLLHIHYPQWMSEGITGLLRTMLYAFILVRIAGWLEKKQIRLQI